MILLSVPSQQRGNADSALGPPCFTVFPNMSQALSVLFYNSDTGDLGTGRSSHWLCPTVSLESSWHCSLAIKGHFSHSSLEMPPSPPLGAASLCLCGVHLLWHWDWGSIYAAKDYHCSQSASLELARERQGMNRSPEQVFTTPYVPMILQ